MGLTSSGGVTVNCKLPALAAVMKIATQPVFDINWPDRWANGLQPSAGRMPGRYGHPALLVYLRP